jgi:hypothetical protein
MIYRTYGRAESGSHSAGRSWLGLKEATIRKKVDQIVMPAQPGVPS